MAFPTTSAWVGYNLAQILNGTASIDLDLGTAGTFKVALFNNTATYTLSGSSNTYNTTPWGSSEEMTGTGYTAGGANIASPAVTVTTGKITWSCTSPTTWATSSITNAYGAGIYHASTGRVLVAASFGGFPYSTTGGTFTINWNGTDGLGYITF